MDLSIIIPAYKEAENLAVILPKIIESVQRMNIEFEILVIDTNVNLDETEKVCNNINVKYFMREGGNNYGDAIRTGIEKSLGVKTIIMDADGSHDSRYIKEMYSYANEYDLIIGSRYINGGSTENNAILIFMSLVVNIAYRVFLKIKIKDISNSFRLYDTKQLKNISIKCDNFDLVEEILIKLILKNPSFSVKEVPIVFKKRLYGESKRNLLRFIFSYIYTIYRLLRIKKKCSRDRNISD